MPPIDKTSRNLKQQSRQEKHRIHQLLDLPHTVCGFSYDQSKELRSLEYEIIAAVFWNEPKNPDNENGERFGVEGLLDPYAGDHHLAKLDPKYYPQLGNLLKHIIFDIHQGRTAQLSKSLQNWFGELKENIQKLPLADRTNNEAIGTLIKKDPFVQALREEIGFKNELEVEEKDEEKAEIVTIKLAETAPDETANVESKNQTPTAKSKAETEAELSKSAKENLYIKALMADILGKKDEAEELFDEAEKAGHKESKSRNKAVTLSEENIRRNALYYETCFFYQTKFPDDPNKVKNYVKRAAKRGIPAAQNELGVKSVLSGDYKNAFKHFKMAADQGDDYSQYNCFLFYTGFQNVVPKDLKLAFDYCQSAADQDLAVAQYFLADSFYLEGVEAVVEKNKELALKYYKLAADQNYQNALIVTGTFLIIEKDIDQARKYLQLSVNHDNNKVAKYLLEKLTPEGREFQNGEINAIIAKYYIDIIKDFDMAIQHYELAISEGFEVILEELIDLVSDLALDYNKGTKERPKDNDKAVKYFAIASKYGHRIATYNVCALYFEKQDYAKWLEYLEVGVAQGMEDPTGIIKETTTAFGSDHYFGNNGKAKDIEKTKRFLAIAAHYGCEKCAFNLGIIYRKEGNIDKEYHYIKLSANLGYAQAQNDLADFYLTGKGGYKQNIIEGFRYCKLGANQGHENCKLHLARIAGHAAEEFDRVTHSLKEELDKEKQDLSKIKKLHNKVKNYLEIANLEPKNISTKDNKRGNDLLTKSLKLLKPKTDLETKSSATPILPTSNSVATKPPSAKVENPESRSFQATQGSKNRII